MKTIDRYLVSRILWPLAATLAVAVFALLLERLVRLLDLVVNKGSPLSMIFKMLTNLVPHYLGIALPAAFFVAVLLAMTRLSRDSEMHAFQAAGIGLARLLVPVLGLAAVLTLCSAITFNYLQPYSRYAYRALAFNLTSTALDAAVESGSFFTGFDDKAILVEGVEDQGRRLLGIFVHQEQPFGGSITVTAKEGRLLGSATENQLILRLHDGVRLETPAGAQSPTVVAFSRFDLPLDLALGGQDFHERGGDEEELTLRELWSARDQPPAGLTRARIDAEIHSRIVRTLTVLVLPFLSIPLGIAARGRRQTAGLLLGVALLLLYHHLLQFGASLTALGEVSPVLGLWLPFLGLAGASAWCFRGATRRLEHNPFAAALAQIETLAAALRHGVTRLGRATQ